MSCFITNISNIKHIFISKHYLYHLITTINKSYFTNCLHNCYVTNTIITWTPPVEWCTSNQYAISYLQCWRVLVLTVMRGMYLGTAMLGHEHDKDNHDMTTDKEVWASHWSIPSSSSWESFNYRHILHGSSVKKLQLAGWFVVGYLTIFSQLHWLYNIRWEN
jgi:hypothetical protein